MMGRAEAYAHMLRRLDLWIYSWFFSISTTQCKSF